MNARQIIEIIRRDIATYKRIAKSFDDDARDLPYSTSEEKERVKSHFRLADQFKAQARALELVLKHIEEDSVILDGGNENV